MDIHQDLNEVLMASLNEAQNKNHEYLTPEHILYAALYNNTGFAILETLGVNIERLKQKLREHFDEHIPKIDNTPPMQSFGFLNVMERAIWHISSAQKKELELGDILVSIYDEPDSFAAYFLKTEGVTRYELLNLISHEMDVHDNLEEILSEIDNESLDDEKNISKKDYIKEFTIDLTQKAKEGLLDPLIGRSDIIERTAQVLCRRIKNNPIHVGEPGVGKTAITEGLALKIASGDIPESLKQCKILQMDMGTLLAGTRFRGDFEERLKKIIKQLTKTDNTILFIDEIHTIIGAGSVSGSSLDASNMLKPLLSSGNVRCIGSTTYDEYKKIFEKDRALSRRFQKIDIPEPNYDESLEIIKGIKYQYESFHNVKITDEVSEAIVSLSSKYINDRRLPDKAIDVLDEVGAYTNMHRTNENTLLITVEDVERIISKMARIPENTVSETDTLKLSTLEDSLKASIFGQDEAISKTVWAIKKARAGFTEPEKPIASFLFAGPTGVGKTELAKQLALSLGISIHRFDMSEYQEKHTVARLIGAPPGYVGYEEGGLLTDAIRNTPHCVLLLDEIEKAHQDIFNTLLQVMDYATLTDNNGRKADFRNVIIIMTSNAGARNLGKFQVGFEEREIKETAVNEAVDKIFSPEFRNRLDSIITFNGLTKDNIIRIVKKSIDKFIADLLEKGITLEISDSCINFIAEKGFSKTFGAREIGRTVETKLKNHFVDKVLFAEPNKKYKAKANLVNDEIEISFTEI